MQTSRIGRQQAIDMKIIVPLAAFFVCAGSVFAAPSDVTLVGHFTNQKISGGDDPHILSGYSLDLYRKGKIVFGNIHVGIGAEEPAHATLYDVKLDEAKKTLSFKAKYSEGVEITKESGAAGREAKALLSFSGRLLPKSVRGTINKKDENDLLGRSTTTGVVMKKNAGTYVPESFESWKVLHED